MSDTKKKGRLFDLPETKGAFQLKGIVSGMEKDTAFKEIKTKSGREVQKFGTSDSYKFAPHYSDNGLLYVKSGTNAFMSGKVVREIDLGTHTMFIAEMTDGAVLSDNPSMTYEYYHSNVKPKPAQAEKKK